MRTAGPCVKRIDFPIAAADEDAAAKDAWLGIRRALKSEGPFQFQLLNGFRGDPSRRCRLRPAVGNAVAPAIPLRFTPCGRGGRHLAPPAVEQGTAFLLDPLARHELGDRNLVRLRNVFRDGGHCTAFQRAQDLVCAHRGHDAAGGRTNLPAALFMALRATPGIQVRSTLLRTRWSTAQRNQIEDSDASPDRDLRFYNLHGRSE